MRCIRWYSFFTRRIPVHGHLREWCSNRDIWNIFDYMEQVRHQGARYPFLWVRYNWACAHGKKSPIHAFVWYVWSLDWSCWCVTCDWSNGMLISGLIYFLMASCVIRLTYYGRSCLRDRRNSVGKTEVPKWIFERGSSSSKKNVQDSSVCSLSVWLAASAFWRRLHKHRWCGWLVAVGFVASSKGGSRGGEGGAHSKRWTITGASSLDYTWIIERGRDMCCTAASLSFCRRGRWYDTGRYSSCRWKAGINS